MLEKEDVVYKDGEVTERVCQVDDQLAMLTSVIEDCCQRCNQLHIRLTVVLNPNTPEGLEVEKKIDEEIAPLAAKLRALRRQLVCATTMLDRDLCRLEI
jgi:hypothetical protein